MLLGMKPANKLDIITHRQLEVINELRFGRSNEEIAKKLFITVKGVKFHFTNIYKLLKVTNRVQLMAMIGTLRLNPEDDIGFRKYRDGSIILLPVPTVKPPEV